MLNQEILNEEYLYRRIPNNPHQWKVDRPSSAAFKDSFGGTSVDRKGERTENDVVNNFTNNFSLKAVVKVSAGYCRNVDAHPIYTPFPPALLL